MLLLGLTGSIATGKSTVSSILSKPPYNIPIVDADIIARKVVEPGTPGYAAILSHFQSTTPDLLVTKDDPLAGGLENGKTGKGRPLNRPALGRRVFGESEERQRDRKVLNGIVHPAVRREMWKTMLYHLLTGTPIVCLDVPLLFESQWDRFCGTVMVVAVTDPAVQMTRLCARDPHLTEEDARNRVLSQGDVREKANRALIRGDGRGVVVWNDGNQQDLRKELDRVMAKINGSSPQWWAWLCLAFPPIGLTSAMYALLQNYLARKAWTEREQAGNTKAKL